MRKKVFGRKLGRNSNTRKALFRSIIRALVISGQIKTTRAKARAVQPDVDKIMSLVRKGDLAAQKRVMSRIGNDREVYKLLFEKYAPLTKKRNSGFTRIVSLPERRGDNAKIVTFGWVDDPIEEKAVKTKKEAKK